MLRLVAVSGCSGPSTFSRIASARSKSGRAAARSPWCLKQDGEIVEARRRIGMLGAEHLLADRQRALEERPRRRKVALVLKQDGEVVEARRRIGMLGTEHLLADRQRALEERPRLRIGGRAQTAGMAQPIEQIAGALFAA